jgi:hypothetical protein
MNFEKAIGKTIESVVLGKDVADGPFSMRKDNLVFTFSDGSKLRVWDGGQQCCEERFITCDDDLSSFKGAKFQRMEIREGGYKHDEETEDDSHEFDFLIVTTSKGSFTCETHNINNGYYSGFDIMTSFEKGEVI